MAAHIQEQPHSPLSNQLKMCVAGQHSGEGVANFKRTRLLNMFQPSQTHSSLFLKILNFFKTVYKTKIHFLSSTGNHKLIVLMNDPNLQVWSPD